MKLTSNVALITGGARPAINHGPTPKLTSPASAGSTAKDARRCSSETRIPINIWNSNDTSFTGPQTAVGGFLP